ncbi:MAG: hypothetical protein ACOC3G_07515, partial [Phycisphaeraceae bacterium]
MTSTATAPQTQTPDHASTQTTPQADPHNRPLEDRYQVTVDQYRSFRRDGFVIVPGLVSQEDVQELRQHTADLMEGKLPEQSG